jgi:hypothetical protein
MARGRGQAAAAASERSTPGWGDRVLDLVADAPGTPWSSAGLRALRTLLLVHAAVRTWSWVSLKSDMAPLELAVVALYAAGISLAALLGLTARYARSGAVLATALLVAELYSSFPGTPNHVWLEFFCLAMFAAFDPDDPREGSLLLVTLRWMAVIVLFHTGLQKLLNGYYVGGEFLAWAVSVRDRFAGVFAAMLPADESARLTALDGATIGSGPYRTSALLFVAASNFVWVAELVLAVLLVVRRTRTAAALATIAFLAFIQLGAREILFALLITQLLALIPPGQWNRRTAALYGFFYLYILAYLAGIVPGEFLARGTYGL